MLNIIILIIIMRYKIHVMCGPTRDMNTVPKRDCSSALGRPMGPLYPLVAVTRGCTFGMSYPDKNCTTCRATRVASMPSRSIRPNRRSLPLDRRTNRSLLVNCPSTTGTNVSVENKMDSFNIVIFNFIEILSTFAFSFGFKDQFVLVSLVRTVI